MGWWWGEGVGRWVVGEEAEGRWGERWGVGQGGARPLGGIDVGVCYTCGARSRRCIW